MTDMSRVRFFGKSDVGLKRSNNEDAFVIKSEKDFVVLADGMGGAAAGEIASQIFVEAAEEVFSDIPRHSEKDTSQLVQEAFQLANERILHHGQEYPHHQGMGSTAELIAFHDEKYVVGHVGDSRTYLFRQGVLRQLTRDHSLIQDQIEQGIMTPEEARKHSLRHVILRAVGTDETIAVDLIRGKSMAGDLFLLCSDGLTDMIDDASIQEVLRTSLGLAQRGEKLIELAKSAGGYDNITVILCEVLGSE